MTANFPLAKVTREFFQAEAPEGAAALAVTDYSLGNLLWLKNPTRAPELPRKLVIADSFAAVQPPDAIWKAYLAEIACLEERGEIDPDEYLALRHSLTARRALMDLTGGDESAFSEGTVAEVLKVAKERLRADLRNEIDQERRRRETAEGNVSQLEQREAARRERITARAARIARVISWSTFGGLSVLLTAGALLTFPWSLPRLKDAWYRYLTSALLTAFFAYTIASMVWGTSISVVTRGLENRLSRAFDRWLSRISD